jgi:two-component system NarL family response regulator
MLEPDIGEVDSFLHPDSRGSFHVALGELYELVGSLQSPVEDGSLQGGIVETGVHSRFRVETEMNQPAIRILVAEDHPVVADGILAVLATAKDMVVVGQARNGAEAIELLKQHQPDIVLLDLRMPVVDGIGVVRWMKRSGWNARTVILTIFSNESEVRQAMQAGVNAYLLKDSSPGEILKTIRRVHRGKSAISAERGHALAPTVNSVDLKPLELDILALIVQGHDNRTIGSQLGLGTDAVKYHLRVLFSKLGVRKRAAAARQAIERGLLDIG